MYLLLSLKSVDAAMLIEFASLPSPVPSPAPSPAPSPVPSPVPPDPSLPPVLKVNCSASEDVCWTTPYSSIVNNLSEVISTSEELRAKFILRLKGTGVISKMFLPT